jgi:hypothetical protein
MYDMTTALPTRLTQHCHNVETGNEVGTARINTERGTPRTYSGRVMQNPGQLPLRNYISSLATASHSICVSANSKIAKSSCM